MIHLHCRQATMALVRALVVIEGEVGSQRRHELRDALIVIGVDRLVLLTERHSRSTMMLSSSRPLPSMLMRHSAAFQYAGEGFARELRAC
jgi:hypothetical protein